MVGDSSEHDCLEFPECFPLVIIGAGHARAPTSLRPHDSPARLRHCPGTTVRNAEDSPRSLENRRTVRISGMCKPSTRNAQNHEGFNNGHSRETRSNATFRCSEQGSTTDHPAPPTAVRHWHPPDDQDSAERRGRRSTARKRDSVIAIASTKTGEAGPLCENEAPKARRFSPFQERGSGTLALARQLPKTGFAYCNFAITLATARSGLRTSVTPMDLAIGEDHGRGCDLDRFGDPRSGNLS